MLTLTSAIAEKSAADRAMRADGFVSRSAPGLMISTTPIKPTNRLMPTAGVIGVRFHRSATSGMNSGAAFTNSTASISVISFTAQK